jgi:hypothetical protein
VNNVITPISLPLFSPVRSTVPLSRNRGSATRTIGGKHKDKVLYRGIGGVQEEYKEAYSNRGIFLIGRIFYNMYSKDLKPSYSTLSSSLVYKLCKPPNPNQTPTQNSDPKLRPKTPNSESDRNSDRTSDGPYRTNRPG